MLGKRRRYLSFFSLKKKKKENEKVNTTSQAPSPLFILDIIKNYQQCYNSIVIPQAFISSKIKPS